MGQSKIYHEPGGAGYPWAFCCNFKTTQYYLFIYQLNSGWEMGNNKKNMQKGTSCYDPLYFSMHYQIMMQDLKFKKLDCHCQI